MPKAYSPILTSSKLLRVRKKKVRNHQATLVMINQIAMPPSVSLAIDEHGGHDGMEWEEWHHADGHTRHHNRHGAHQLSTQLAITSTSHRRPARRPACMSGPSHAAGGKLIMVLVGRTCCTLPNSVAGNHSFCTVLYTLPF